MRYSGYIVGATMAAVANGHATLWNLHMDGVDQGVGNVAGGYIRYPPNNNPVKDLTSADMTCNVANVPNTLTKTVTAGSELSFEWHHESNAPSDDIIAVSHKGPIIVYIAPTSSNGAGDVWVKIAEDGYDASTKLWAVDTLRANKGIHSFTLPAALADGDYLLRGEIIALHEGDASYSVNPARGAQFYMGCVQVTVTGGGSTALPAGVAIPGAYTDADVLFNVYGSYTSYPIPGPALWSEAGGDASSTTPVVPISAVAKSAPVATPAKEEYPAITKSASVASSSTKSACKAKTTSFSSHIPVVTSASAVSTHKSACSKKPTTLQTMVKSTAVASSIRVPAAVEAGSTPVSTGGDSTGSVALYGRCGGNGYTGSTTCASGTCIVLNEYFSQCT